MTIGLSHRSRLQIFPRAQGIFHGDGSPPETMKKKPRITPILTERKTGEICAHFPAKLLMGNELSPRKGAQTFRVRDTARESLRYIFGDVLKEHGTPSRDDEHENRPGMKSTHCGLIGESLSSMGRDFSACFAGNFRRRRLKTRATVCYLWLFFDGVCMLTMAAFGDRLIPI